MKLTIVKEDNIILVDGLAQSFDLSGYSLPENLWALQWQYKAGEIEYTDENNETIDSLPDWTNAVVEEHKRLVEDQKLQQEKENQQNFFLQNGHVRIQRIQRQNEEQKIENQKSINDYVRRMF